VLNYLGVKDMVIPSDLKNMPLAFHVNDSRLLVSEASRVHVSNAYNRTDKTSFW